MVGGVGVLAAAALYLGGSVRTGASVPTATVARTEFVDIMELRSDIRPVRSVVLGAPMQSGELQIVRLVKNGSAVTTVSVPPTSGQNNGAAGIAFSAEDNRGLIGGQQADNLVVTSYRSLSANP
jgi:hypothetical protein